MANKFFPSAPAPTPARAPAPLTVVTCLSGVVIALLGALVLTGWYVHNFTLLQVKPTYVAMQVNAALAFLASGVAVCLSANMKRAAAAWVGSIAGLIGLLTAIEYLTGLSLGIDQLLLPNFTATSVQFPGRMAPSTAFCFVLVSASLWAASRSTPGKIWSVGGLVGSLIAGFGIIGALGYYTNLPATFVWGSFSSMAVHTAFGFIVLGVGLITLTLKNEQLAQAQSEPGTWLGGAVAFATFTVFIGAAQSMLANEEGSIQSKTKLVALAETTQIETTLKLHIQAIERMAQRAEIHPPSQTEWESDAQRYVEHSEGTYDTIKWLDASFQTRWIIPHTQEPVELLSNDVLDNLYSVARKYHQVKVLKFISPQDGNTKFLILAPIYRAATFEGLIVTVINPESLFKKMTVVTEQPYGYSVQSGSEFLYRSIEPGKSDLRWIETANGNFDTVAWTVKAWPVNHAYSPAAWFIILAGVLSAGALGIIISKSQASRAKSRELQFIIDTAPVGMLILNAQGQVKQINHHAEQLLGYASHEIQNQSVRTLIPHFINLDDPAQFATTMTRHTECICKDGSAVYTEFGVKNIVINSKKFVLLVLTDITQRKSAEQQLESKSADLMRSNKELNQLQLLLQTTIDHMPALVGSWDIDCRNRLGNRAYIDWFGISPEQMRGKPMREIIGEHRFEQIQPYLLSVLQGNSVVFERTLQTASGETRHAVFSYVPDIDNGVVNGFFGFVSDITQLKQAQLAKEVFLTQLQNIINAAQDFAIIETDTSGLITLFSRGAELLMGYAAHEMVGKARIDIGTESQVESVTLQLGWQTAHLSKGTEHQKESISFDWNYRLPNGTPMQVNQTIVAVRDTHGSITGYLGIAKDIRKEKEILRDLAEARDKAQAANLAKSQFLANMSHEIRTPMNAILGMQQLLQHSELSPRQLDYALKTQSAAQALLGLLNDILDFSKVEANKMVLENRPFRLDAMLRDLSVICSSSVGNKDIDVLFSVTPDLPPVVIGDEMRLRQVLINLAGNAIKFTQRGVVSIALTRQDQHDRRVNITFSIQDSGIGIDAEHLAYIFEGFSQAEASTTRRFGGTGLGLAISQRLVTLMGGELKVDSKLNLGSRFYFTLPLVCADDLPQSIPLTASGQRTTAPHRVLIVDDNARARQNIKALTDSLGWPADVAASSAAALELLHNAEPPQLPYDVIFIDSAVQDMNGVETAKKIRAWQPADTTLQIILLGTTLQRQVLSLGSNNDHDLLNGFLIKPVTASMIFDAVNEATLPPVHAQLKQWQSRLKGLRILVVEDNSFNLQVISEFLSGEGALVETAEHGRAGIDRVFGQGPALDAVLMDIQMPVMDGYEATRLIRQSAQHQALPVIALTANAMPGDKEACRAAGMNDHVAKPIDLNNLIHTLLRFCQPNKEAQTPAIAAVRQTSVDPAPDVEFDLALKRLAGNHALFAQLAGRFQADTDTMYADFALALSQNRRDDAVRFMHTLKGIAAQLGATALSRYAAKLEVHIHTGSEPLDAEHALQRLRELTAQALSAVHEAIAVSRRSDRTQ